MRNSILLLLLFTQLIVFGQNDSLPKNKMFFPGKRSTNSTSVDFKEKQKKPNKAQQQTVQDADTSSKSKVVKPRSPLKASLLATALPGAGQIYNRKYWKAPIVIGGGITFYLMYDHYNRRHDFWHQILVYKDRGGTDDFIVPFAEKYGEEFTNESPEFIAVMDQTTVQLRNDAARKRKQQIIIWSALFYVAQIVDATVDAHFSTFDVTEELSLDISPASFQSAPWAHGVKLSFSF